MTEEEWCQENDPTRMLAWLEGQFRTNQRKLRLFVLAACRQIETQLREPFIRLIQAAEDAAEFSLPASLIRSPRSEFHDALLAIRHLVPTEIEGEVQSLTCWAFQGVGKATSCVASVRSLCPPATPARQADLIRELFGNPFRKIRLVGPRLRARVGTWTHKQKPQDILFVRDWLQWDQQLIPRLAEEIHSERNYSHVGYLADALEDAGCDETLILDHLRQPGEHYRGCWVLDLVLGRE